MDLGERLPGGGIEELSTGAEASGLGTAGKGMLFDDLRRGDPITIFVGRVADSLN